MILLWKKPDFEISHKVLCLRWILSKALCYTLAPYKELWRLVPGGVLGPKTDEGVPLAAENWTQKDRGKNEIWGLKDRIL